MSVTFASSNGSCAAFAAGPSSFSESQLAAILSALPPEARRHWPGCTTALPVAGVKPVKLRVAGQAGAAASAPAGGAVATGMSAPPPAGTTAAAPPPVTASPVTAPAVAAPPLTAPPSDAPPPVATPPVASPRLSRSEQAKVNGAKSRGPVTDEGKAQSRLNALRHGLCARGLLTPDEDPAEYEAFVDDYRRELHAVGTVQKNLAERAAEMAWKLRRIPVIEAQIHGGRREARGDPDLELGALGDLIYELIGAADDGVFDRVQRYETRLERSLRACLRELRLLQGLNPHGRGTAAREQSPAEVCEVTPNVCEAESGGASSSVGTSKGVRSECTCGATAKPARGEGRAEAGLPEPGSTRTLAPGSFGKTEVAGKTDVVGKTDRADKTDLSGREGTRAMGAFSTLASGSFGNGVAGSFGTFRREPKTGKTGRNRQAD
ncbi:hypothetical protein [Humisphaera borealis]|uniref:Uncharacterized protein n=1 Tax=Humisphaera borealis TaxID=2807512 RepID=A0A7M2WYE0_9BACT|nr:hypothetical protein [Humisphaera borealis]QOV90485.1 hypothetical protein IPV69_03715 [Humisphaera borealis]